MTITNGAGVEERQEDWTVESIIEDWIADKKLSRRKVTWLEAHINEWLDFMDRDLFEPFYPASAPTWMKSELDNPKCKTVIQCVADLVDFLKPKRAGITRLEKVTAFLKRKFPRDL